MKNTKKQTYLLGCMMFCFTLFLTPGWVGAADSGELVRQVQKSLSPIKRHITSEPRRAEKELAKTLALFKELKAVDPNNKNIPSLEKKIEQINKKLSKRLGKTVTPLSKSVVAPDQGGDVSRSASAQSAKLPGGVKSRIKKISQALDRYDREKTDMNKSDKQRLKGMQYNLRKAEGIYQKIQKRDVGKFNEQHPDYISIQVRFNKAQEDVVAFKDDVKKGANQSALNKERQKVLEEEWSKKIQAYIKSGESKALYAASNDQQPGLFKEFKQLMSEYKAVNFPQEKSGWLLQIENDAFRLLDEFPKAMARDNLRTISRAETKIDQELAFLESKQEWKSDSNKRPYVLSSDRINDARKLAERAAETLPADDSDLIRLNQKLSTLVKVNNERQKTRAERTRMIAGKFSGDGAKAIKKKASELVEAKFNDIKILRSTIISEDWKEETVEEWTDTTRTAIRIRTTRSVTAQVGGKKVNGDVRVYTLHIAKDRLSNGGWGKLHGNLHSDLGDAILEKNIMK